MTHHSIIDARIERAQWLLANIKHAAMATVNADGTPHNTPYFFMASTDLKELYWGSHPASLHSQNIERTGRIFVVLYEAHLGGGLYIECSAARRAAGEELERALAVHNQRRRDLGKDQLPLDYYSDPAGQSMYIADAQTFWVNYAERDAAGLIVQDKREEVSRTDLLVPH